MKLFLIRHLLYITDIYRNRNKVTEHVADSWKCHQLLITRDSETEHFLQSLWQLSVSWRVRSEYKREEKILESGIDQARLAAGAST